MLGRTHFIVDHTTDDIGEADPAPVVGLVRKALAAGVPVVRLRSEVGSDRARYELARAVVYMCRKAGATCVIGDRVDIAIAAGADGVHLGPEDMPVREARRLLGADGIVGASARNAAEARRLVGEGASYIGAGPCYPAGLQPGEPAPIGTEGLRSVAVLAGAPVIAAGGVSVQTVPELVSAGAYGVAVRGAIVDAPDPEAAARRLVAAVESASRATGGRTPTTPQIGP